MNNHATIRSFRCSRAVRRGRGALALLWLMAAAALLAGGCSRLVVESTPPGAAVLWSPNGLPPWRPWPPAVWGHSTLLSDRPTTPVTPMSDAGSYRDYVFVTVEMPGYYRPRPQLAGLYNFRTERLRFDLVETPERFAERQRAMGRVRHGGAWVDPKALGLVEHGGEWVTLAERERRVMTARGLVELDGRWMNREERDLLVRTRRQAAGLVEWKDRWVKPAEREAEARIDQAVARLAALEPPELQPPKVIVGAGIEGTRLALENATNLPTRWLISGARSQWLDLPPHTCLDSRGLELLPGRYTIAVFAPNADDPPTADTLLPASLPAEGVLPPEALDQLRGLLVLSDQPFTEGFAYSLTLVGGAEKKNDVESPLAPETSPR